MSLSSIQDAPARCESERPFALTAPQMAIWLDQALHPHKPIYNTGQVLSIQDDVDLACFDTALRRVVVENDALRMKFAQRGAEISQHVVEDVSFSCDAEDFSAEAHPEAAANAWLDRIFWRPVEPTDLPLFRFALAKISPRQFAWLQCYHHLIIDATGRQLVSARVAAVYDALRAGREPPEVTTNSYRIAREAEDVYLASDEYVADEAYWKERLASLPAPVVRSPAQRSERLRSGRPARIDCGLSAEQSAALRLFARDHGSTAFKVVLCLAWCWFSRMYQTTDLIFGVPLAGRGSAAARSTVALFAKVMPFRVKLDPAMTLRTALAALDRDLSEDLKHQRFPADHINRLLQLRRFNRAGLYEIGLNYVRSDYTFSMGGSPIACSVVSSGFALPWTVSAFEFGKDDPIRLLITYDQGRVRSKDAELLALCLRTLLGILHDFTETPLGELPMEVDCATARADAAAPVVETSRTRPIVRSARDTADRLPRDDIEAQLLDIWQRHLGTTSIGIFDDYFCIGGDSLKAIMLLGECNEKFGTGLPLSALFECPTIFEMAAAVRKSTESAPRSRLVNLRRGTGGPALLLIHPVGGSVICYADLVAALKGDWPIYGLEAAGLQGDECLPGSLEEMAADYLHLAAAIVDAGPIYLAGWSFGGLVAFEMARQLASSGRPAASVILIDTPSRRRTEDNEDEDDVLRMVTGALGIAPERATADLGLLHEQIEPMARVIRNARRFRESYQPSRLSAPLTLIRAGLEPGARDEDFEWSALAKSEFNTIVIPATHDAIIHSPHVGTVAAILSEKIVSETSPP